MKIKITSRHIVSVLMILVVLWAVSSACVICWDDLMSGSNQKSSIGCAVYSALVYFFGASIVGGLVAGIIKSFWSGKFYFEIEFNTNKNDKKK